MWGGEVRRGPEERADLMNSNPCLTYEEKGSERKDFSRAYVHGK
jgi:hypothetical protein